MQAAKSKRADGKVYTSYLVRESYRTAQGLRSRTVCNLTHLPPAVRDFIAATLKGQAAVPTDQLQLAAALDYGGLAVLNDAWARFGLDALLAGLGTERQPRLLKAIIYSRLLLPCAKLSLAQQARGTWLAAACGPRADKAFDEDELYAAMDQLNGHWVALEKGLYQQAFPAGVRLVLYDLTSVYFEGQGPAGLARYGHSRDHRADRPQILLAVATDAEGVPLQVSVLRGNRSDTKTLQGLWHTLRRRFGITEATFVFDGGMSSKLNLAALPEAHLTFVTRLSTNTLQTLVAELELEAQLELGDDAKWLEITQGANAMCWPVAPGGGCGIRPAGKPDWPRGRPRSSNWRP